MRINANANAHSTLYLLAVAEMVRRGTNHGIRTGEESKINAKDINSFHLVFGFSPKFLNLCLVAFTPPPPSSPLPARTHSSFRLGARCLAIRYDAIPAPAQSYYTDFALSFCHYSHFLHRNFFSPAFFHFLFSFLYVYTFCSIFFSRCILPLLAFNNSTEFRGNIAMKQSLALAMCTLHSLLVLYKIFKIIIIISTEFKVYCFNFV